MNYPFSKAIRLYFTFVLLLFGISKAQAQYCNASSGNTTDEWLSNVRFADIDNPSISTTYSDFTDVSTLVERGVAYEFNGTVGNSASWNEFITVFIDFNQDEDFDDEGEKFNIGNCYGNCSIFGEIIIPGNATPGTTRMRVVLKFGTFATTSCFTMSYGEVEDYSVIIDDNEPLELASENLSFSLNPTGDIEGERPSENNPEEFGNHNLQTAWDYTLFPNPVGSDQNLQLVINGLAVNATLQVHDLSGRAIWKETLNSKDNQQFRLSSNAPNLNPGTYLITVSTPSGIHKTKTLFINP